MLFLFVFIVFDSSKHISSYLTLSVMDDVVVLALYSMAGFCGLTLSALLIIP